MHPLNVNIRLFKSKLGRKFFTVFVCCALLPILTLSSITYTLVTRQLADQARTQLQRAAKSFGLTIYDRLMLVDTQLQLLAISTRGHIHRPDMVIQRFDESSWSNLNAIVLMRPQKAPISLLGGLSSASVISSFDWSLLASGNAVLMTRPSEGSLGHKIFLARQIALAEPDAGILLAEIKPRYLWSLGDAYPLPPMTEFCVLDGNNNLLINTITSASDSQIKGFAASSNTLSDQDRPLNHSTDFIVSQWSLFLKAQFSAPGWKIVLTQLNAEILKPLQEFRRVFLLSILLTFWVILLISIRYIRKSLIPLEKLEKGTHRILQGEFNMPVIHRSGDEFDNLIDSFNQMSSELGRQVRALRVIAQIGRKTAGITDPHQLLEIELRIMEKELQFAGVLALLIGPTNQSLRCVSWYGWKELADNPLNQINISIENLSRRNLIVRSLEDKEAVVWHRPKKDHASLSQLDHILLKLTDAQMLYCMPIIYENLALGLLIVESQKGSPISESDQQLVKGIAAQTASGIHNGISFKKLQGSEERFRSLFDNSAAGMGLIDAAGMVIKVNVRFGEILGYAAEQLHGVNWRQFSHPEDIDKTLEIVKNMQSGGRSTELYEKRFIHSNGSVVPVMISTSMVRDESGDPLYYITHVQDLTEQKAAKAAKKEIEHQLVQSQKLEAMGTLAGGIAHDFNNIISAVMGQAELGLLEADNASKHKGRFDGILQASKRAKALVRQILTFSRKSEQKKQVVHLGSLIKEAVELLRATFPANITIESDLTEKKAYVLADPNNIHQVIMNLGTNAYHAMADTGGILSVQLDTIALELSDVGNSTELTRGNYVRVRISDTGCGIDPENLNCIFDPYFTTKAKGKGTGLGLALVHGILKAHQGSIAVESIKGKGTIFEIRLPRWEEAVIEADVAPEIKAGGSKRILFVDDEPLLIELGKDLLTHLGHQVESCQNPVDALNLLRSNPHRFDVVITDYNMPKINGDELAREIENIKPDLAVILCSGYQDWRSPNDDLPKALKAILPKPFTLKELSAAIDKALQ